MLVLLITGSLVAVLCSAKETSNSRYRSMPIDAIVLHAIAGPSCDGGVIKYSNAKNDLFFWGRFFERHPVIGIHYLVGRDGRVLKSIDEDRVANHAIGWNERSIGIELINKGDGKENYPHAQMLSLEVLLRKLRFKYPLIKIQNIVRHSDVDKRVFKCGLHWIKQKQDPGSKFEFKKFLKKIEKRL
jgi:N-acetyl-anhydromuramyl-L-alanine amidase AmpD